MTVYAVKYSRLRSPGLFSGGVHSYNFTFRVNRAVGLQNRVLKGVTALFVFRFYATPQERKIDFVPRIGEAEGSIINQN